MFEIVRTLNESDRKSDFIALAFLENRGIHHAAIIINFNNQLYQFHYTGADIDFGIVGSYDFFHKITETVDVDLTPAFYAYCRQIQKKAKPQYGYFYSGEYYDKNGIHFSEKSIGERMTCVGFCLNVLKGFLEEDYVNYQDWDERSHDSSPGYLIEYAKRHNLDINDISKSHRRITPLELLTSAFFAKVPILKSQIDSKIEQVKEYIFENIE